MSVTDSGPRVFQPLNAQYPGDKFVIGGGVAIFHLATGRVVICSAVYHGQTYYFLPKGRRDAGEESGTGAEREGYEEVCVHDDIPQANYILTPCTRAVTATDAFHYPLNTANPKRILVYTHHR
jgi:8-oxo-dGTP pyrophosphatase MutT (NUDIX family)